MPSSAIPFCIAALEGRSANGDLKGFLSAGALNIHKMFASAGGEEISLVNFKMLKALCLSIRLGKDGTQFRNAVAGLADVDACLARVNEIVGRHEISDGEANAYIEDMLEDMGIPETAVKDEPAWPSLPDFGDYRSPHSSPISSGQGASKHGSGTSDGSEGDDSSMDVDVSALNLAVKTEQVPPTPIETIIARARTADLAGLQSLEPSFKRRRRQDDMEVNSLAHVPGGAAGSEEQPEAAEDRGSTFWQEH